MKLSAGTDSASISQTLQNESERDSSVLAVPRRTTRKQRREWVFVLAVCCVANVLVAAVLPSPDNVLAAFGIGLGIVFGQVSLLAMVMALSDIRLPIRLALTIAGLLAMGIVMGSYVARHNGPAEFSIVMGLAICVQFLWLQIPLITMRVAGGWRIRHPFDESAATSALQFGIRQILVWTAVVAVLTAMGRQAFLLGFFGNPFGTWVNFLGPIVLFNGLVMLAPMWAILLPNCSRHWRIGVLVYVVGLTAVEIYLVDSLGVVPVTQKVLITCLNGVQVLLLILALRAAKSSGLGLRRVSNEVASAR
jgi:hypothetical protein